MCIHARGDRGMWIKKKQTKNREKVKRRFRLSPRPRWTRTFTRERYTHSLTYIYTHDESPFPPCVPRHTKCPPPSTPPSPEGRIDSDKTIVAKSWPSFPRVTHGYALVVSCKAFAFSLRPYPRRVVIVFLSRSRIA